MKRTFQINSHNLKPLLKQNLWCIVGAVVLAPVVAFIKGNENHLWNWKFIGILIVVIVVFNIPGIYLLIDYYFQNRDTKLEIDTRADYIKISKGTKTKTYRITDIESSVYNIGKYYQNAIDDVGRWATLHSDLGYWDLKFKNGDRYYLSNLIIDFLLEEAFISNTKYRFRFIPYIDTSNSKKAVELKRQRRKTMVEQFVSKYENKSESELNEILDSKESYQQDAIKAAELVLRKKKLGNKTSYRKP